MSADRSDVKRRGEAAAREWNTRMEQVARRAILAAKGLSEAEVRSYLNRLRELWPRGPEPEDPDVNLLAAGIRALHKAATCLLAEEGFDGIVNAIAVRERFVPAELRNEVEARVRPKLLGIQHVAEYVRTVAQNVAKEWGAERARFSPELPDMAFEDSVRLLSGRSEELEDNASRPDVEHDLAELKAVLAQYEQSLQGSKLKTFYDLLIEASGEREDHDPRSGAERKQRQRMRDELRELLAEHSFASPSKRG